jgi:conjugative transfer region protein TrbK
VTEERQKPARRSLARVGWRSAAIASGVAAVGIIMLVVLDDPAPPPARYAIEDNPEEARSVEVDPLRSELARCRTLPANTDDARCSAAWEVNRRRFMGESRSYVVPVEPPPIERTPSVSSQAASAAPTDISTPER